MENNRTRTHRCGPVWPEGLFSTRLDRQRERGSATAAGIVRLYVQRPISPMSTPATVAALRVGYFRWTICALLFFATTINYIDRQILSLVKEQLDHDLGWSATQFGLVNSAFQ